MFLSTRFKSKSGKGALVTPLRNDRGAMLIAVALALVALFAFAVIAIDGAIIMAAKNQLQNAADAAALAGASGLLANGDQTEATQRAIAFASYNKAVEENKTPVLITAEDVAFPEADVCRVRTHRTFEKGDPIRTYFLRVIGGGSTSDMTAVAAARAYDVCGSKCIKPWVIPDRWEDANGNGAPDLGEYDPDVTGYTAPRDIGVQVVLKVGNPHQSISPGIFFPVDFPPLNKYPEKPITGGDAYREWIHQCEPYLVEPGDELQLEPGNMVGPTKQGMEELIAQDPGARWDAATQSIVNSAFGLSPRIGIVPFFDPTNPPVSGRNTVFVVKLGAFFIEEVTGGGDVTGRFIQITTGGVPCGSGPSNSLVKGIELIE